MTARRFVAFAALILACGPAYAGTIIADTTPYYMPYPVVMVHGIAADSRTWDQSVTDYSKFMIASPQSISQSDSAKSVSGIRFYAMYATPLK